MSGRPNGIFKASKKFGSGDRPMGNRHVCSVPSARHPCLSPGGLHSHKSRFCFPNFLKYLMLADYRSSTIDHTGVTIFAGVGSGFATAGTSPSWHSRPGGRTPGIPPEGPVQVPAFCRIQRMFLPQFYRNGLIEKRLPLLFLRGK